MEEKKKKKHCFARCKSKSNKENSSLMSSDVGFQFVIPFYLQLLGSTVELPDLICKKKKEKKMKISLLQSTIFQTSGQMSFIFRKYCCRCHSCKTETAMQTTRDSMLSHVTLEFVCSLTSLMLASLHREQLR